jgi:hypothetical protein
MAHRVALGCSTPVTLVPSLSAPSRRRCRRRRRAKFLGRGSSGGAPRCPWRCSDDAHFSHQRRVRQARTMASAPRWLPVAGSVRWWCGRWVRSRMGSNGLHLAHQHLCNPGWQLAGLLASTCSMSKPGFRPQLWRRWPPPPSEVVGQLVVIDATSSTGYKLGRRGCR